MAAALEPSSCAFFKASASSLAFSSLSSRSRSYPSCLILSASSIALRSASAKSTGLVLAAPKPNFDFLGAVLELIVDPPDEAEFKREVPAPGRVGRAAAEEVSVRGVGVVIVVAGMGGLVVVLELLVVVVDVAESDLPIMGGVAMRGVPGLDDLGVGGLDQESKKSSSVSSLVVVPSTGASIPSTTIPLGNLNNRAVQLVFG